MFRIDQLKSKTAIEQAKAYLVQLCSVLPSIEHEEEIDNLDVKLRKLDELEKLKKLKNKTELPEQEGEKEILAELKTIVAVKIKTYASGLLKQLEKLAAKGHLKSCDLMLGDFVDEDAITDKIKENASVSNTPILARIDNTFYIYGCLEEEKGWKLTPISITLDQTNALKILLQQQQQKQQLQRPILKRQDKSFNDFVIHIIKKGHAHPVYDEYQKRYDRCKDDENLNEMITLTKTFEKTRNKINTKLIDEIQERAELVTLHLYALKLYSETAEYFAHGSDDRNEANKSYETILTSLHNLNPEPAKESNTKRHRKFYSIKTLTSIIENIEKIKSEVAEAGKKFPPISQEHKSSPQSITIDQQVDVNLTNKLAARYRTLIRLNKYKVDRLNNIHSLTKEKVEDEIKIAEVEIATHQDQVLIFLDQKKSELATIYQGIADKWFDLSEIETNTGKKALYLRRSHAMRTASEEVMWHVITENEFEYEKGTAKQMLEELTTLPQLHRVEDDKRVVTSLVTSALPSFSTFARNVVAASNQSTTASLPGEDHSQSIADAESFEPPVRPQTPIDNRRA